MGGAVIVEFICSVRFLSRGRDHLRIRQVAPLDKVFCHLLPPAGPPPPPPPPVFTAIRPVPAVAALAVRLLVLVVLPVVVLFAAAALGDDALDLSPRSPLPLQPKEGPGGSGLTGMGTWDEMG
jgi:hypothetical protein